MKQLKLGIVLLGLCVLIVGCSSEGDSKEKVQEKQEEVTDKEDKPEKDKKKSSEDDKESKKSSVGAWSGKAWSGNSWSGKAWSGESWEGSAWSGEPWSGTPITPGEKVEIEEDEEVVMLQINETFLFDFDKDQLKPEAKEVLGEVVQALRDLKGAKMEIHGHTDSKGTDEYNLDLSKRRAAAVKAFFEDAGELDHIQFATFGHGKTSPIESNDTEEGRQKNRRVELAIEPKS
ncbi:OmpA family protein [Ferdinandcohnia quinoae]|uniref:OmpA family protein n=1 Tax=Fredinandcohnia quinoae TaxID=2918902 RepID=A0AAW5E3N6_9BACI|nr:OmpA family protein [Fredinandcohnia sp. SECRCQ15]MCH1624606.1 OmpA family protein [Fredinandcohnia sp. SECRCQ15]